MFKNKNLGYFKMVKKSIIVNLSNGFHIRPATRFVKEARKFISEIKLKFNGNIVDAKSLLKVQTLGISNGSKLTIIVNGKDEDRALKILYNLVNKLE